MKKYILVFLFAFTALLNAQITWTPNLANETDSITVLFDASQGSRGLFNYTGDVYAHTGVITNLSVNGGDWKYVKTEWGVNTPETKLERVSSNIYKIVIKPSVRTFYGVPSNEQIKQVAFVFRSGVQVNGNWLEGKTATGGDIFLPLYSVGLSVAFVAPDKFPYFTAVNDTIKIKAVSSHSTNLSLYVDNSLVSSTSDSTLNYNYIVPAIGKKWIKAVATGFSGTKSDSFYYVVNAPVITAGLPAGTLDGINYISNTSVVLSLYAPQKQFVYLIGDFNNWEVDPAYMMKRTPDSVRYWIQVDNLIAQKEYIFQYFVDGSIRIADPYTEKTSDPANDKYISTITYPGLISYPSNKTNEIASVLQTAQTPFQWQVTSYQRPKKTDLVIYELLIRDFLAAHDYKTLADTLNYLKNLGVNVIELMPVMEFEGNESWGYNSSFHLAPDKYYGPKNELKKLIDKAHSMGMVVIMDMVLNHVFGSSPLARLYWDGTNNRPAANNPWLNTIARHPFNVGNDFNHESAATKAYVDRVNKFWITEYNVDGFRFDLSKGFTQVYSGNDVGFWGQYDQSRINLLKRMADQIWLTKPETYVILEHFADNSEEKVLSGYGMMLWGNMNYNYGEASMGYISNSNFSWGSYKTRDWTDPNLVTYMESHDEERMMFRNITYGRSSGSYNVKDPPTALQRVKLAEAFFYTIPGPKMLWQFGELGYDVSIDFNGRLGNKPIRWNYFTEPERRSLYDVTKALTELKQLDVMETTIFNMDVAGAFKRIKLVATSLDVIVIGNFDVVPASGNGEFTRTGYWYNYLRGDSMQVINPVAQITLQPGEFHIFTSSRLPKPQITDVEDDHSVSDIKDFILYNNYPNPFNPSTRISYNLAEASNVRLEVFDALGRKVAELVNIHEAAGMHNINFNSADYNLSSGMYLYRLTAGSKIFHNKMVLLK